MPLLSANTVSPADLERSYQACLALARKSRSNFYCSFFALPQDLFRDTCVLYAYMRLTDDLGDDEALSLDERRERLRQWKSQLTSALDGQQHASMSEVFPALVDMVQRHHVPRQLLFDVITGVESDLAPRRFADQTALERYCYHVAGVVGLACIHIWGFDGSAEAEQLAIRCGLAFQLTNILRDIQEDARRGRVYLPQDQLARFGCTEADLHATTSSEALRAVIRSEAERATAIHREAADLLPHLSADGRRVYRAMHAVYGELLRKICRREGDVLGNRVRVSSLFSAKTIAGCLWSRWLRR